MADLYEQERELEDFFQAARDTAPVPSAALLARVLADAAAQQPAPVAAPRRGIWRRLSGAVGGWPALAGLATATLAGVWIGYAAPGAVGDLAISAWPGGGVAYDVVDLIPSMDGYLAEDGA